MVTIGMNYDVLEGKEAAFEHAFRQVLHAMRNQSGHCESRLYREVDAPRSYLIISHWTDRGAFDAFIHSDAFRKVADWGKEQILAGRPQHHIYGA
ncbi:MAG TPA: antibiotic biosynthesis monooxygenase [Phycisphaerae bacterium]|nr:antibiotic biosynthesis monooxygenase [Phycisphaerae bacterium]HNU45179.1 antibiotic biosynthesis monooxygenase [Phycisphaerae bacterium]